MKVFIYVEHIYGGRYRTRCLTENGVVTDEVLSSSRKFCEGDIRRAEERHRLAGNDVEWIGDGNEEKHEGLQSALRKRKNGHLSDERGPARP